MNIFRFLHQLICSHPVQELKCDPIEGGYELCGWRYLNNECKGCPYSYFECQECGKRLKK